MLNRVVLSIYQLRRVHAVLPDAALGNTLKSKLLRLSLQPSLQHFKQAQRQQQQHRGGPLSTNVPSSSGAAESLSNMRHADPFSSPSAISPSILRNLLDCLAYFQLGTSAVAKEALQLVQLTAPTMSTTQLCSTLAACCALGAQHDITATALPLLSTALSHYRCPPSSSTVSAAGGGGGASLVEEGQPLLFATGASIVLLITAMQQADVREKEVWHLIAEHCLQHLESLDGRQLCAVVQALCTEGIDNYPDFFVAAERHITSQPPTYLSPDHLHQIVQCYKELHQPVVALLAVMNATPQNAENLDRSISAAATVAALSSPHMPTAAGGGAAGTSSASVQQSLEAFEVAAVAALAGADAQAVLDLLLKCELRRVMTPRVMDHVLRHLLTLFYPALSAADADVVGGGVKAKTDVKATAVEAESGHHSTMDLHRLSQCLAIAMQFNDAALFVPPAPVTKRGRGVSETAALKPSTPPPRVTVLLDAVGGELSHWYSPRLLQLVPYAVKLLPPAAHPRVFFTSLVAHLRRSSDLTSHEEPAKLHSLVEALLALRAYGGEATLVSYMPVVTVAVLNAPRKAQLELTAMMAHLSCTSKELVPSVYRQWGTQKRWLRTITEDEVGYALHIMARSGQRDSQLLHAIVAFVQTQRGELPPQRVVDYLHQLARVGVRDLELFTQTAEHLMRRAVEATPSALQGGGGRDSTRRHGADRSASATASSSAGAASAAVPSSSPSFAAAKHQQWQITTVHDLALLLYTFTFVLRDSIRVTQQIIARLKMCSGAATPRDVSLALYSFVKLCVRRNDEVTGQLCERAAATLSKFTASEVASTWSSLRCLHHPNARLQQQTLELLAANTAETRTSTTASGDDEMVATGGAAATAAARPRWRFSDADCLSLGSALLLTAAIPLNPEHPLALRRGATAAKEDEAVSAAVAFSHLSSGPLPPSTGHSEADMVVLPPSFERLFIDVCRRLLPSATGQRLYLILCSLSRCKTTPPLSLDAWGTVLQLVDTHAESLTTGRLGDAAGLAQLEVLDALRLLHRRVADMDALAAADAVRVESGKWAVPYCPPGLWTVLRPRWRELTRNVAVQTRPSLMALVAEMKVGGVGEAEGAALVQERAPRQALVRRGRKPTGLP